MALGAGVRGIAGPGTLRWKSRIWTGRPPASPVDGQDSPFPVPGRVSYRPQARVRLAGTVLRLGHLDVDGKCSRPLIRAVKGHRTAA